jgi:hypothetical protein
MMASTSYTSESDIMDREREEKERRGEIFERRLYIIQIPHLRS